jgi:hypothetical protein
MTTPLSPDQTSAKAIIQGQLQQWGLDSLGQTLDSLIKDGLGPDAITLKLQDSPEYQQRFKANAARLKKGLPILTPAQYIAAENSYRQVLQSYGLPQSFYDTQDDFHNFLSNDVSPDEVKQRAADAQNVWLQSDDSVKSAFRDYYGVSDGAAIASILDPDRALPIVNRMALAAQIGGAATRNGLSSLDPSTAEAWADRGATAEQAQKAFGQIGATAQQDANMAARFGSSYSQSDAERAALFGDADALKKQQQMYSAEKGLFSATAAATDKSQSRRTTGSY